MKKNNTSTSTNNTNNNINTNMEESNMNTEFFTASNGIVITIKDLEKAIKIADVNWTEAAYANDKAASSNPLDICIFDFFSDAWDLVDDHFVEEYDDCDGDTAIAIARVIEGRANVWHDWAKQNKETEELCYRVKGEPFSLGYAKLFIACNHIEYYYDDGLDAVLSICGSVYDHANFNNSTKCYEYEHSFEWGNVKYDVTLSYKESRVESGEADGEPDYISVKVEANMA